MDDIAPITISPGAEDEQASPSRRLGAR